MYHTKTKRTEKKLNATKNKNDKCYFEQILEAATHKTAFVRPPASNLINHLSKMKRTYGALLEKKRETYNWRSFIDSYI